MELDVMEPQLDHQPPGPDEPAGGEEGDDGRPERPAFSLWQVAVLGAALVFLGFAIGTNLAGDGDPGGSSIEVGFAQDMIDHHAQAIQMSNIVIADTTADPIVRHMAREVIFWQGYETGIMDTWLREWGVGRADPERETVMRWMGEPTPFAEMPGWQDEDDVRELADLHGRELDVAFLTMMQDHHAGGLHMAEYAAAEAGRAEVRELAVRMARNQAIEVREYQALLDQFGA